VDPDQDRHVARACRAGKIAGGNRRFLQTGEAILPTLRGVLGLTAIGDAARAIAPDARPAGLIDANDLPSKTYPYGNVPSSRSNRFMRLRCLLIHRSAIVTAMHRKPSSLSSKGYSRRVGIIGWNGTEHWFPNRRQEVKLCAQ
jgi:hypothetical protein